MKKIIGWILAIVVAATGITVGVAPTIAAADGAGHYAKITYVSGPQSKIQVCRSAATDTSCAAGVAWLPKGKNTKTYLGFSDTDLIWVDSGYKLGGIRGPRYVKISGAGGTASHPIQYNAYLSKA